MHIYSIIVYPSLPCLLESYMYFFPCIILYNFSSLLLWILSSAIQCGTSNPNYYDNRIVYPHLPTSLFMFSFLDGCLYFIFLLYMLFMVALSLETSLSIPTKYHVVGNYTTLMQPAYHDTSSHCC